MIDFSLKTYLRHFYLYEYAFKPRVELVLRTDIFGGQPSKAALTQSDAHEVQMLDGAGAKDITI